MCQSRLFLIFKQKRFSYTVSPKTLIFMSSDKNNLLGMLASAGTPTSSVTQTSSTDRSRSLVNPNAAGTGSSNVQSVDPAGRQRGCLARCNCADGGTGDGTSDAGTDG